LTIFLCFATVSTMLKIRLQRVGRVHEPVFRLVLTDSKNATKSGKYLENLGNFDSRNAEKAEFKADRITYWLGKGAQATTTVYNLLINKKVITGKKINALPLKKPVTKETVEAPTETVTEGKADLPVQAEETPSAEAPVQTPVAPVAEQSTLQG